MGEKKKTFREVREEWWVGYVIGRRENTIRRTRDRLQWHVAPFFDDLPVGDITDVYINQYIIAELEHGHRLTGGPLNQNSVRKTLHAINLILKYAKGKRYIQDNPMDLVPRLQAVPSRAWYVYTPDEVAALVKVARPKWMGDAILIAYHNGLRKEEVFGLRWVDIDFDSHLLHVKTTITASSPRDYYINDPKTPGSLRDVLFDRETEAVLRRRWDSRTSEEWLFANQYGQEMNPWYTVKYFRAACAAAGIPMHRFHDLRHTHITELVEAGLPLPIIQRRAGHKNINTTLQYTHISTAMQQSVVDYLNNRGIKKWD